jgi:hypothetical protein
MLVKVLGIELDPENLSEEIMGQVDQLLTAYEQRLEATRVAFGNRLRVLLEGNKIVTSTQKEIII